MKTEIADALKLPNKGDANSNGYSQRELYKHYIRSQAVRPRYEKLPNGITRKVNMPSNLQLLSGSKGMRGPSAWRGVEGVGELPAIPEDNFIPKHHLTPFRTTTRLLPCIKEQQFMTNEEVITAMMQVEGKEDKEETPPWHSEEEYEELARASSSISSMTID